MLKKHICFIVLLVFTIKSQVKSQSIDSILSEVDYGTGWTNNSLWITRYNSDCSIDTSTGKMWNPVVKDWGDNIRDIYHYDKSGKIIEKRAQTWSHELRAWVDAIKSVYEYKKNYSRYTKTSYYWSTDLNWEYSERYSVELDLSGNISFKQYELFQTGIWRNQTRDYYSHDAAGFVSLDQTDFWDINGWQRYYKSRYRYDIDHKNGNSVGYFKMVESNSWFKNAKQNFSFVPGSQEIKDFLSQETSDDGATWLNQKKRESTLDKSGRLSRVLNSEWDKINSVWTLKDSTGKKYYDDGSVRTVFYSFYYNGLPYGPKYRDSYTHLGCLIDVNLIQEREATPRAKIDGNSSGKKDREYITENLIIGNKEMLPDGQTLKLSIPSDNIGFYYLNVTTHSSQIHVTSITKVDSTNTPKVNTRIYPNPARDYFVISADEKLDGNCTVKFFDAKGDLIFTKSVQAGIAQKIELPVLAKGRYSIVVTSSKRIEHHKLILQ